MYPRMYIAMFGKQDTNHTAISKMCVNKLALYQHLRGYLYTLEAFVTTTKLEILHELTDHNAHHIYSK